jgi:P22 tail accessory factor
MTTARDIIERAFRKPGVVASDEPMTADQAENGVNAMNDMMHGWLLDGIDVGHVDLELADVFPLEPQYVEGTVYLLAERLSPDYSAPANFSPREFKQRLSAAFLIIPDSKIDTALARRRTWWAT